MSFTPIKDVNLEIMSKMDDDTLLSVCATNRYGRELCRNEGFWHKRFLQKYGEMAAKWKPAKRSWKNHYMKVIIDINSYPVPPHILSRVIWDPRGAEYSTFVSASGTQLSPFLKADERFLNAFYLMDLGPYFNHQTAHQVLEQKASQTKSRVNGKNIFMTYRLDELSK